MKKAPNKVCIPQNQNIQTTPSVSKLAFVSKHDRPAAEDADLFSFNSRMYIHKYQIIKNVKIRNYLFSIENSDFRPLKLLSPNLVFKF